MREQQWDSGPVVSIGIADGGVVNRPMGLRTTGLGSCVGLVVYDELTGVAGMVHVMLPQAPKGSVVSAPKYANLAIPWLVDAVCGQGAVRGRLRAKMAGGAQMFSFPGKSDLIRVGPRNIEAVHAVLQEFNLPIVAEDVGGSVGRTIQFSTKSCELVIRTARAGIYTI